MIVTRTLLSFFFIVTAPFALGQGVATQTKKAVNDAKAGFFDLVNKNSLTVDFDKNSAVLKKDEMDDLRALVKGLDAKTTDLKLVVAGWADKEYPSNSKKDLSKDDVTLAQQRTDAIVAFLKNLRGFSEVESLNMAKHENRFAQFLGTDAAEVKDAIKRDNAEKTWVQYEADVIDDKGGPSQAAVLIYDPKKAKLSH